MYSSTKLSGGIHKLLLRIFDLLLPGAVLTEHFFLKFFGVQEHFELFPGVGTFFENYCNSEIARLCCDWKEKKT